MTTAMEADGNASQACRRVLLVEDQLMMAQALEVSLGARGFDCRIATLDGPDGILAQAVQFAPDLVLLDLNLGSIAGLQLVAPLVTAGARVLVVSGTVRRERLAAAMAAGAIGWVSKSGAFEELVDAVARVLAGEPPQAPSEHDALLGIGRARLERDRELSLRLARLTAREREVLDALSEGHAVHDIAKQLYVSIPTVRTHVRSILQKLGVSTQLAAVAVVHELRPD